MSTHRFATPQLESCDDRFRQAARRTESLISRVPPQSARWKPSADRWSILECLDHLVVLGAAYDPPLRAAIDVAIAQGPRSPPFRRGTLLGRILVSAVTHQSRRVKTPDIFRPTSSNLELDTVAQGFFDLHRRWDELLKSADGFDLGVRLSSPASRWVRLNLEQAFELLSQHELRHVAQAERVVELEQFPG